MFFTRHGRPWSNPIIARSQIDFFPCFIHINVNFSALKWAIFYSLHGCQGNRTVAMDWLPRDTNEQLSWKPEYLLYWIKWYLLLCIVLVAMENFEKCTVPMLGAPCLQHVTGNTSRLNQPQSAIIQYTIHTYMFAVVNFDALAQASDFQIGRRQVVFLCWMQDLIHTYVRTYIHTYTHVYIYIFYKTNIVPWKVLHKHNQWRYHFINAMAKLTDLKDSKRTSVLEMCCMFMHTTRLLSIHFVCSWYYPGPPFMTHGF